MAVDGNRRTQLLRGSLDLCLLALLHQRPAHAYELAGRLQDSGLPDISYGTLYPLVTRLRRLGLLEEESQPSPTGPPRKVYSLSALGRQELVAWAEGWRDSTTVVHRVLADADLLTDELTEVRK